MSASDDDTSNQPPRSRANTVIGVFALLAGVGAFIASLIQGAPGNLPSYALGWALFLYVERALFAVVVVVLVGVAGRRILRGDEVDQLGAGGAQMKFADAARDPLVALREAVDEGIKALELRLLRVERDVARIENQQGEGAQRRDPGQRVAFEMGKGDGYGRRRTQGQRAGAKQALPNGGAQGLRAGTQQAHSEGRSSHREA